MFYHEVPEAYYSELDSPTIMELINRTYSRTGIEDLTRVVLQRNDKVLDRRVFEALLRGRPNPDVVLLALHTGTVPETDADRVVARTIANWARFPAACARGMATGPETVAELAAMVNCTVFSAKCRNQLDRVLRLLQEYGIEGELKAVTKELVVELSASHKPDTSTYLKPVSPAADGRFVAQGLHPHITKLLFEVKMKGAEVLRTMSVGTFREVLASLSAINLGRVDKWWTSQREYPQMRQTAIKAIDAALAPYGMSLLLAY